MSPSRAGRRRVFLRFSLLLFFLPSSLAVLFARSSTRYAEIRRSSVLAHHWNSLSVSRARSYSTRPAPRIGLRVAASRPRWLAGSLARSAGSRGAPDNSLRDGSRPARAPRSRQSGEREGRVRVRSPYCYCGPWLYRAVAAAVVSSLPVAPRDKRSRPGLPRVIMPAYRPPLFLPPRMYVTRYPPVVP